jgi:hypothetical protein
MGKPRSSKSAETDFDEYVTRRISELGLPTNLKDIRTAATQFETLISFLHQQANVLIVLSAICLGFILYMVVATPDLSAFDVLLITLCSGRNGSAALLGGFCPAESDAATNATLMPCSMR